MPDCDKLELLSVKCTITERSWKKGQINRQFRSDKTHGNKDKKINLLTVENKCKVDYLLQFLERRQTWQPGLKNMGNAQGF